MVVGDDVDAVGQRQHQEDQGCHGHHDADGALHVGRVPSLAVALAVVLAVPAQDAPAGLAVLPQAHDDEGGEHHQQDERGDGVQDGREPEPHVEVGREGVPVAASPPCGVRDVEGEELGVDDEDDDEEDGGDDPGAALGEEDGLLEGPSHGQEALEAHQHQHPVGVAVDDVDDKCRLTAATAQVHLLKSGQP